MQPVDPCLPSCATCVPQVNPAKLFSEEGMDFYKNDYFKSLNDTLLIGSLKFKSLYAVKIQNNVSVYDNVHLEDGVFCGPSMVFTNVYNPRSLIDRKDEYRDTLVSHGATLGANCTIVCGVTIGRFAFIGAGTVVNKNIKPYALVVGVPGKQIGWMSEHGEQIPLPLEGNGEYKCEKTGDTYKLVDDTLTKEE